MGYGIPYMGSKNKIVKYIIDNLPPAENFYDLFAGGCAVTHAAIVSGKYKKFYLNDINPAPIKLFIDSIDGKFENEKKWISKEEFKEKRYKEPYISYCWSFGSQPRKSYAYSDENEFYKEICFQAIVNDNWDKMKEILPHIYKQIKLKFNSSLSIRQRYYLFFYLFDLEKKRGNPDFENNLTLQKLESIESLNRLFRIQNLAKLKQLITNKVTVFNNNYCDIEIKENSTVYCDPPYRGTSGYNVKFDFDKFYEWLRTRPFPVYVSEYVMPEDFIVIGNKAKVCTMGTTGNILTQEKIFIHQKWKDILPKKFKPVSLF